jgi:DNA polymerase-1
MAESPKKLVLIDGNAIIHRAYHALPPLTTKKGELVNAVYGFTTTLLNVLAEFKPDYIIATFDLAGPTFRHEEYKEYKATRVKADQALYDQIPRVKDLVRAFNIPIYSAQGFEADDAIGTIVQQSEEMKAPPTGGIENIIVTGDLDTLQLVSGKTKVYTMRRGLTDSVIYDENAVFERYGLKPSQMIDYKGLRGDASDNIPGVKGIGEKTAVELLKKYETLEGVYAHIGELKGAVKEKLERDKMIAIQSKHLATINTKIPVKLNLADAATHNFDRQKIVNILQELEFFSLIKRIPSNGDANPPAGGLNAHANNANKVLKEFVCNIKDEKNLDEFIEKIKEHKEIAIHLRTIGERLSEREIKGIAINFKAGGANFVAYSENNFRALKPILESGEIKKIGYDLKTDMEVLQLYGIALDGIDFDVMLGAYVLDPGSKIELPRLVLKELNEEVTEEKKKGQLGLEIESLQEIAAKTCQLADYIGKLKRIYEEKITEISGSQSGKGKLREVFSDLEMPLIPVLAEMEINGIKLNTLIFEGISEKINKRVKNLEDGIYKLAGKEFNINSPRQLADVLFIDLKIPTADIKKGKTGYSTASMELEKLRDKHKIIEKIEEYREIFKLKTTYLDTLPLLVDKSSRIHTSFNQAVTATGRLSSSDPNLQNIPIRTDIGQLLRTAFEAEEGWRLIAADYSQIDLRVMAHVSGDKKLVEVFYKGEDVHQATAALINNVTLSQVTDKMRRGAKELNFGVIYGISPFGFAMRAGVDRDQAKKFIDEYFKRFPDVAGFMAKTKEFAKKHLYVETEMGRRRYIPEINSPNFMVASAAERMAINLPIQGLSADIMKLAMIKLHEEYKNNPDVRMLLQVHDEIIFEVKEEIAEKIAPKIKEIMESVYKLRVPLIAQVKIGDNWGEI